MSEGHDNSSRGEILKDIISDYEKEAASKERIKEDKDHKQKIKNRAKRLFLSTGIYVITAFIFILSVYLFIHTEVLSRPKPWVVGVRLESDYKLGECILNLWQIRKAIDTYYDVNDELPQRFDQLYGEGFLKVGLVCPVSGKEYILKYVEDEAVFSCPTPEEHGVSGLWLGLESGPPIIERK